MPNAHPLQGFNKEEIIHYARSLIRNAESRLETDDAEGAAWRLADALGALTFVTRPGTIGIDQYTGLGFRLDIVPNDNSRQTPES